MTADEAIEAEAAEAAATAAATAAAAAAAVVTAEAPAGDAHGWLAAGAGTRIRRMVASPGAGQLAHELLDRIFST